MNTPGTQVAEHTLNEQPTADELFSAMTAAITSGNAEDLDKLMTIPSEATPPAPADGEVVEPDQAVVDPPVPDPAAVISPPPSDKDRELEALRAELHAIKSRVGRVDAVQAQLAEVKKLVSQQAAAIAAQPKPPSKIDEKIASLREIDPEMADTLSALREEFAPPKAPDPAPVEEASYDEVEAELARVRRVHPDLDTILVGGRDRTDWEKWKSLLRPEHRALAESPHAEELAMAVSAFKNDLAILRSQQAPAPAQAPAPDTTQQDARAAQVAAERERKLQSTGSTRPAPIKQDTPAILDAQEFVSKMYKEIQKRDHLVKE